MIKIKNISAKNFCSLTPQEQATALGIDTSEFDAELKELKSEFTLLNREYKAFGELKEPEKVEKVSITELLGQKEEIEKFNAEQREITVQKSSLKNSIDDCEHRIEKKAVEIEELRQRISELEDEITNEEEQRTRFEAQLGNISGPKPLKDTTKIVAQIGAAEDTNEKAAEYQRYLEKKKEKASKKGDLEANKNEQGKIVEKRLDYIKKFDFGFAELSVDDNGGLTLQGRPIKEPYFSKGELEIIVAKLHASTNPDLKMRFIDDFDLLDEKNQKRLVEDLTAKGFQLLLAQVGSKKTDKNTILLKRGKVVDTYEQPKAEELF